MTLLEVRDLRKYFGRGSKHELRALDGVDFVAAVENGPLSATQFHPEKSGDAGAHLLRNWLGTLT